MFSRFEFPRAQLAALLSVLLTSGFVFAEAPPVQIQVHGEHVGRNLIYHYKIVNNSDRPFLRFAIGVTYDNETQQVVEQLGSLPVGWQFGREGEGGTEIILDPSSSTQPQGWAPWVYGPGFYGLVWRIPFKNVDTPPIEPHSTVEGFSVTVPDIDKHKVYPFAPPGTDEAYYRGNFEIVFPGDDYYGTLEVIDTQAPALAITVDPASIWPPNGKLVPVSVSVKVRDDYDSQPAIRLESITANEVLDGTDI